jgi:hypothetical protein
MSFDEKHRNNKWVVPVFIFVQM